MNRSHYGAIRYKSGFKIFMVAATMIAPMEIGIVASSDAVCQSELAIRDLAGRCDLNSRHSIPFAFTVIQRKELLKVLNKKGPAAEAFLDDIQPTLNEYRAVLSSGSPSPTSRKAQRKYRLEEIRNAALTVRGAIKDGGLRVSKGTIENLIAHTLMNEEGDHPDFSHLTGDEYFEERFKYEFPFDLRAEEILERLLMDMETMISAIDLGIKYSTVTRTGRPHDTYKWEVLYYIAEKYKMHFNKIPAAQSRGRFHKFVIKALGYLGIEQKTWYRPLKAAIDVLNSSSSQ